VQLRASLGLILVGNFGGGMVTEGGSLLRKASEQDEFYFKGSSDQ